MRFFFLIDTASQLFWIWGCSSGATSCHQKSCNQSNGVRLCASKVPRDFSIKLSKNETLLITLRTPSPTEKHGGGSIVVVVFFFVVFFSIFAKKNGPIRKADKDRGEYLFNQQMFAFFV